MHSWFNYYAPNSYPWFITALNHGYICFISWITVLSCFALKLFTTVTFCDSNTCISDAQFGFKKGGSTVDAIFALDTLIKHYQNNNKRMYVECIDLNKCFDSMYRNALWFKLFNSGIQGKVLQIIRNMYQSVTSCVKHCYSFSDYFEYSIGLRQGEIMSPVLVSRFF